MTLLGVLLIIVLPFLCAGSVSGKLHKIRAGLYRHEPTGRLIVRTSDTYEGPRGGNVIGWEHARRDGEGFIIDSACVFPTLREAVKDLERAR